MDFVRTTLISFVQPKILFILVPVVGYHMIADMYFRILNESIISSWSSAPQVLV